MPTATPPNERKPPAMFYKTAEEAQTRADALNAKYGKIVYRVIQDPKTGLYRPTTR